MKILILTTLSIFVAACSSPQIHYDSKNTLSITMHGKSLIERRGELLLQERVNLQKINIQQKVFHIQEGPIITYEDAKVTSGYQFSYGMKRTLHLIFPQYQTQLLYTKGNLHFYELNKGKESLYLILENMNKKRVKFLYGFNKKVFEILFSKVVPKQKELKLDNDISLIQEQEINKNASSYIKSRWNTKNIILDGLIMKTGGLKLRM